MNAVCITLHANQAERHNLPRVLRDKCENVPHLLFASYNPMLETLEFVVEKTGDVNHIQELLKSFQPNHYRMQVHDVQAHTMRNEFDSVPVICVNVATTQNFDDCVAGFKAIADATNYVGAYHIPLIGRSRVFYQTALTLEEFTKQKEKSSELKLSYFSHLESSGCKSEQTLLGAPDTK